MKPPIRAEGSWLLWLLDILKYTTFKFSFNYKKLMWLSSYLAAARFGIPLPQKHPRIKKGTNKDSFSVPFSQEYIKTKQIYNNLLAPSSIQLFLKHPPLYNSQQSRHENDEATSVLSFPRQQDSLPGPDPLGTRKFF